MDWRCTNPVLHSIPFLILRQKPVYCKYLANYTRLVGVECVCMCVCVCVWDATFEQNTLYRKTTQGNLNASLRNADLCTRAVVSGIKRSRIGYIPLRNWSPVFSDTHRKRTKGKEQLVGFYPEGAVWVKIKG